MKGKGIPSQKIDTLAAAIVARVNGQQLTNTQRSVLSFELGRPSVQKVINELIQKKSNGIDSAQSNVYDKDDVVGGLENREEAALWDLAYQRAGRDRSGGPGVLREIGSMPPEAFSSAQRRGLTSEVDVFGDNDYATVMEGSSLHQVQKSVSEEGYDGGTAPDFYVGPNGKALPSQYKDWIGTNIQKDLLDQAENPQLQNAIKQLYRGNSFIGDGGTADVIRFEKQTGLMLGKNGGSHVQKGIDMAKYIENKILTQDLSPSDRALATQLLEDLYNAISR